jgi:siroheme decarboxylase
MPGQPQAQFPPNPATRSDLPGGGDLGTMEDMSVSEEPVLEEPRAGELHVDQLEDADRELLNAVQWDFPLEPRPYLVLAERLGSDEAEVRARIARVKELGVLRQLSAIFDTRALGYGSSLVAAKIDPDRVDEAAAVISAHPGVSHNYKRNHAYNLWYTIAVPPGDSLDDHIEVLHRASGALVTRKLPTLKLYKIGVKLDMTGQTPADARFDVLEHERPERREHMDAPELSDLEVAAIRISQEDLPLIERPFAAEAEQIGTDEETLLAMLRSFKERKLMRRFAAVMNHRSAGYKANAMGVWAVPDEELDEMGPRMAGFAFVSHCYKRPTYEDWPYSVFTMVHGHNGRDCEQTIAAIQAETGVDDYALLWSVKEYKKTRVRYFTDEWDDWRRANLTRAGA